MKLKVILPFLMIVTLIGSVELTFAQSSSSTSEKLEKVLNKMKLPFQYSSNLEMYKVEYCRLSNCATLFIDHKVIDKQDILKFYIYIGSLKDENLRFYQTLNEANVKLGLGSLLLYSESKDVLWFYVILGMDIDNIAFYCDYVLNQQSSVYSALKDYLKE